jgi:hypothetical protein
MGPFQWPLPLAKQPFDDETTDEIQTARNGQSRVVRRVMKPLIYHRHLSRLILEGAVFPKLRAIRPYLNARTTAPMAGTLAPPAQALISALREKNITGVRDMHRVWYGDVAKGIRGDPNWLLDEMSMWVHSAKKFELKKLWPPIEKNMYK